VRRSGGDDGRTKPCRRAVPAGKRGVVTPPRLYLSHDTGLDWLMALEFGRVDDAQPPDCWRGVTDAFGFLHDTPGGRVVGFKVVGFSQFDPEDHQADEIWGEPRFDVPLVGLANASAGEVALAARTFFDGRDSLNRMIFAAATQASGEEAVALWRQCLEAGDAMAHFALGYTLFELGHHQEAYRHLRHYTEIAPHGSWNWRWYGCAAEAVRELSEARRAYRRAVELEEAGDQETDAAELLERMTSPAVEPSRTSAPPHHDHRVVLWGDELPQLGRRRVEAVSRDAALGLTAGEKPKGYAHTDPNEDAVAVVEGAGVTLLVCADGHNGMAATRAAVEAMLARWGDDVPSPAEVSDEELVSRWLRRRKLPRHQLAVRLSTPRALVVVAPEPRSFPSKLDGIGRQGGVTPSVLAGLACPMSVNTERDTAKRHDSRSTDGLNFRSADAVAVKPGASDPNVENAVQQRGTGGKALQLRWAGVC
jgi:hypothetical protein